MFDKVRGVLRSATAVITGNIIEPILGMDALGGIFARQMVTDSTGAAVPVLEIDPVAIVTTSKSITAVNSIAIAANAARKSLEFFNQDSANSIFIAFEGVTATTSFWEILPRAYYSPPLTVGEVNAICDTALTATLLVNEGT